MALKLRKRYKLYRQAFFLTLIASFILFGNPFKNKINSQRQQQCNYYFFNPFKFHGFVKDEIKSNVPERRSAAKACSGMDSLAHQPASACCRK
jgi:hypothetical protein